MDSLLQSCLSLCGLLHSLRANTTGGGHWGPGSETIKWYFHFLGLSTLTLSWSRLVHLANIIWPVLSKLPYHMFCNQIYITKLVSYTGK